MSRIRIVALDMEIPNKPSPARKKALAMMRRALTLATTEHNIGGVERKYGKRKPVTLPAVKLKDFDE